MDHNDSDLCDCGHDRGSHWDGTGKCGYCGTPGNGPTECPQFREPFTIAYAKHVGHFLGEIL